MSLNALIVVLLCLSAFFITREQDKAAVFQDKDYLSLLGRGRIQEQMTGLERFYNRSIILQMMGESPAQAIAELKGQRDVLAALVSKIREQGDPAMAKAIDEYLTKLEPGIGQLVAADAYAASETFMKELKPAATALAQLMDKRAEAAVAEKALRTEKLARQRLIFDGFTWGAIGVSVVIILVGLRQVLQLADLLELEVKSLHSGVVQSFRTAKHLSESGDMMADSSQSQTTSLEQITQGLKGLSSQANENTANAESARGVSESSRQAAQAGASNIARFNEAMDAMARSTHDVSVIIKTIDEIAFQTNILALNAAVEAARAGESGAGFGVVAEEIRNLAQRSAQAARETAGRIEKAQQSSQLGIEVGKLVGDDLAGIDAKSGELDALVARIAIASRGQTEALGNLSEANEGMRGLVSENEQHAAENAKVSHEMQGCAEEMERALRGLEKLVGVASNEL